MARTRTQWAGVSIPLELGETLTDEARRIGISRSRLVRDVLEIWIQSQTTIEAPVRRAEETKK